MILGGPKISTRFFSFDKEDLTLIAEDSTLRANGFTGPDLLYDDACDIGFTLVSTKTGNSKIFYHEKTIRDSEGDILYWTYNEIEGPKSTNLRVKIFND